MLLIKNFHQACYQGDGLDKLAALMLSQKRLMHNSSNLKPV
jgi:hypothetical protein